MSDSDERAYDAILVDLDGTLVDDSGEIRPTSLERVRRAHEEGVRVMIATGRSEAATIPVLEQLGFDTPAVVFNGAGVYCPIEGRLIEERVLSGAVVRRMVEWARESDALPVVVGAAADLDDREWPHATQRRKSCDNRLLHARRHLSGRDGGRKPPQAPIARQDGGPSSTP